MHDLWMWSWLAAAITGVLVWGLIGYASIRFRRRSESEIPVQTRYNLPIEILYTVAPLMMVIVLFKFTVETQNEVLDPDREAEEVVTVVGQQWSWTFNYNLGYDDESRSYEPEGGDTVFDVGTPAEPPTLYLVKDKTVELNLFSPDVAHSFWVPAFLFKMDVIPGRANSFTVTPDRLGTYVGRCAELCGTRHSRMLFDVKVVEQDEYDQHLADLADQGNTGPALGGADADSVPGLQPAEQGGEE
ncbi:cytochrome c oxidase subunit II [Nocardioides aequoreus]|uniref:aa3-type cytochrome oxidase subunit II n=1 Tax=Nocardioides aequoreus TaxID=397278 RepID=UPI003CCB9B77